MELIALWKLFKRRWWLILLPAAVALLLTLPTLKNVIAPPVTYSVQMRLTAAAPPDAQVEAAGSTPYEDSAYVPLLASEYVVVNMPHWIMSDRFADEVSAVLSEQNVNISGEDLRGAFYADSLRSILTLYVSWDNSEEIRAMTDAAVVVLQTRSQDYFPQFAAQPVQVVPLDDVKVNQAVTPLTSRMMPLLKLAVGLAAGLGLAVLAEYLDQTVRSTADIEALGLPVLGEIPRER